MRSWRIPSARGIEIHLDAPLTLLLSMSPRLRVKRVSSDLFRVENQSTTVAIGRRPVGARLTASRMRTHFTNCLTASLLDAAHKDGVPAAGIRVRSAALDLNCEPDPDHEFLKSRIGSRRPNGHAATGA
jgi:hypothetical protein